MKKLLKNKYSIAGIIALVLVIANVLMFYSSFRIKHPNDWVRQTFVGQVVNLSDTQISVKDKPGKVRTFNITPNTHVQSGRTEISFSEISVGKYVVVRTNVPMTPENDPSIIAQRIQLLDNEPKGPIVPIPPNEKIQ